MRIHHIGYLCKDINKTEEGFLELGYLRVSSPVYDPVRQCNISFLKKDGYNIELVNPVTKDSPIFPLLEKYKDSPYHFCYEVADLEKKTKDLLESDYFILKEKEIAPALDERNVVFLYKKGVGMIELLETIRNEKETYGND